MTAPTPAAKRLTAYSDSRAGTSPRADRTDGAGNASHARETAVSDDQSEGGADGGRQHLARPGAKTRWDFPGGGEVSGGAGGVYS